jgi:CBS domain-containing protein
MNAQREQITPSHPIRAIMAAPVVTVDGRASLRALAETLTSHHIGALVVTDEEEPVGIASERDVVSALAEGGDPDEVWAEDVVAIHTLWGDPDDTISQAARYMRQAEVRHVPVSHDGDVIGIVSIRDILDVLLTATGAPDDTGPRGGGRD